MKEGYILTTEECLQKGGHVYENFPPVFGEPMYRICKYCGHRQQGFYPDVIWEDIKKGKAK